MRIQVRHKSHTTITCYNIQSTCIYILLFSINCIKAIVKDIKNQDLKCKERQLILLQERFYA